MARGEEATTLNQVTGDGLGRGAGTMVERSHVPDVMQGRAGGTRGGIARL